MTGDRVTFGIVVFPGSNCDHDAYHVCKHLLGHEARFLWHKDADLHGVDAVILPGGFSYGDYLRCGAIARFSPVMAEVIRFARDGGPVLGICNGFQVLLEAGLLPGVLLRNASLKFVCRYVSLRVENAATIFTGRYAPHEVIAVPVAHGEGNYFADDATLEELEGRGGVVFRYCTPGGEITPGANPNGSVGNIAGIINAAGNVMGMMPHPERASDPVLRHTDGQRVFLSMLDAFLPRVAGYSPTAAQGGRSERHG